MDKEITAQKRAEELEIAAAKSRQNPSDQMKVPLGQEPPRFKPGGLNPDETLFFVEKLMDLLNLGRRLEAARMELA
jgi:hypothetical protein